jgi:hypothetical protein
MLPIMQQHPAAVSENSLKLVLTAADSGCPKSKHIYSTFFFVRGLKSFAVQLIILLLEDECYFIVPGNTEAED